MSLTTPPPCLLPDRANGGVLEYSNKQGEKSLRSIGNQFDRYKWAGTMFVSLLSISAVEALWSQVVALYSEYAAPFMRDRGFPEEVCACHHHTSLTLHLMQRNCCA
jgi:hypothetical protein